MWGRGGHDGAEVAERRALARKAYHVNPPSGCRSLHLVSRRAQRTTRAQNKAPRPSLVVVAYFYIHMQWTRHGTTGHERGGVEAHVRRA